MRLKTLIFREEMSDEFVSFFAWRTLSISPNKVPFIVMLRAMACIVKDGGS